MELPLFDPIRNPYRGLRTYPDASAIPPGYWKEAKNIRTEKGAIELRAGETLVTAGPTNADACYGAYYYEQGLYIYMYAAVHISTDGATVARIYLNQYTLSSSTWGGWVEVSAASGAYGNTRMTVTDRLFQFLAVPSRSSEPTVVVQNGVDNPRLILGTQVATIQEVEPPDTSQSYSPIFGFNEHIDLTAAATATNSTGARFAASTTGSATHWRWTFTTPTVNDTAELALNTGNVDFSDSRQVILLMPSAIADSILPYTKWELKESGGNYYTIHDPENGIDTVVSAETDKPGIRMYGISCEEHTANIPDIVGIRLTVNSTAITGGTVLDIYAIIAGGRVPGFSEYAITYESAATQTESPPVVLQNPIWAISVQAQFSSADIPTAIAVEPKFFPVSDAFFYTVRVPTIRPISTEIAKGVNRINVYRKDPGEEEFYFVFTNTAASYSGSWAYAGDYASAELVRVSDSIPTYDKTFGRYAPDEFNEPVPISNGSVYANGRHYTGTFKVAGKPYNFIKVSELDEPFRFASISQEDVTRTAFSAELEGVEVIRGFLASSASFLGTSAVKCYTDRNIYLVDNLRLLRLSTVGCQTGSTIAESRGVTFWLDSDLSIRRGTAGIEDVSRLRIDDILTGATSTSKASGSFWRDRYYLAYSGGVLVWSELLGDWESLDTPAIQPVQFLPWRAQGNSYLYFISATGAIYRYESGTTDASTEIDFALKTPDLFDKGWNRISLGEPSIVCSDKNSETMTATLVASSPANTQTGTASLDAGGSETTNWREFYQSGGRIMDVEGASINIRFAATVSYPFTVRGLTFHRTGEEDDAGRNS